MNIGWRDAKAYCRERGITRAFFPLYVVLSISTGVAFFLLVGGAIEGLKEPLATFSAALILLLAALFVRALDQVVTTHLVLRHMHVSSLKQK